MAIFSSKWMSFTAVRQLVDALSQAGVTILVLPTSRARHPECPTWMRFLGRVTDGNTELRDFLQRVVGYSLTGSTREEALFFLHGGGAIANYRLFFFVVGNGRRSVAEQEP